MQLAKENNTKVLLDGQGADEILAGYHSCYTQYFKDLRKVDYKKYRSETKAYSLLHAGILINTNMRGNYDQRLKASVGLHLPSVRNLYQKIKYNDQTVFNNDFYQTFKSTCFKRPENFESLNHHLYSSTMQYGLQELLRYADRNSMAHSREIRLPFLSHNLVEFIFSLPAEMKIKDFWTKWIMRQTFQPELPEDITWRKDKIGFELPQKKWIDSDEMKSQINNSFNNLVDHCILKGDKVISSENLQWKILSLSQIL